MLDSKLVRNRAGVGRDRMLEGRRMLDLAQGIVIALRRCPADAAFTELVAVAHEHDVSVSTVAWGLVTLAAGAEEEFESQRAVIAIARLTWGDLLDV